MQLLPLRVLRQESQPFECQRQSALRLLSLRGHLTYRFGGQRVCENKQVRTDLLDEAVWKDACDLLCTPDLLRQEYKRRLAAPSEDSSQHKSLAKQVQNAQRSVNRLIDAYADGVVSKEEFKPRIERARARFEKLRHEVEELRSRDAEQEHLRQALACLDEFSAQIGQGLEQADWTTRREIIRTLVDRVQIEKDQVCIVYRINFPLFAAKARKEQILHFRWRRDLTDPGERVLALRS